MDPNVSTSFIPKKNLEGEISRRGRSGATGLVLLVAALMFVASLVAAGGVFVYQGLLKQSLASKQASLALNEKAYDPGVIQELTRIDDRLKQAGTLLKAHLAPSTLFAFLSQQTLENVQFTSFNYEMKPDGSAQLALDGVADSFSTVALQSDQFAASKALKDIVFSNVNINSTNGKVGFSVSATIIPSLILYSSALSSASAPPNSSSSQDTTAPADASSTTQ